MDTRGTSVTAFELQKPRGGGGMRARSGPPMGTPGGGGEDGEGAGGVSRGCGERGEGGGEGGGDGGGEGGEGDGGRGSTASSFLVARPGVIREPFSAVLHGPASGVHPCLAPRSMRYCQHTRDRASGERARSADARWAQGMLDGQQGVGAGAGARRCRGRKSTSRAGVHSPHKASGAVLAARERDGRAVGARAVARVRGSAWTCVSASRAAQEPCSKRRSSRCGLARRERSVEPRHHHPKSQSARSGGPTEFPTGPERSVWRPDRFPTGPERSVWRPDRFHSTARKKTVFNEKYGFVVDFFDRRSVTVRVTANRMPTDEPRQSHYHLPVAPPALHARVDCPPIPIRLCPPIPAVCVPRAVRSDTSVAWSATARARSDFRRRLRDLPCRELHP